MLSHQECKNPLGYSRVLRGFKNQDIQIRPSIVSFSHIQLSQINFLQQTGFPEIVMLILKTNFQTFVC